MAKHGKKRVHVVFYRRVKGSKHRKRVDFWRKIGGKRKGTRAMIPTGGGKSVSMRVKLSDCVTLSGNMRCTVKPIGRKRKK